MQEGKECDEEKEKAFQKDNEYPQQSDGDGFQE